MTMKQQGSTQATAPNSGWYGPKVKSALKAASRIAGSSREKPTRTALRVNNKAKAGVNLADESTIAEPDNNGSQSSPAIMVVWLANLIARAPEGDRRRALAIQVLQYLRREDQSNIEEVSRIWKMITKPRAGGDANGQSANATGSGDRDLHFAMSTWLQKLLMQGADDDKRRTLAIRVLQYLRKKEHPNIDLVTRSWNVVTNARFAEDGVATIADTEWVDEPKFKNAYEAGRLISVWGHDIRFRAYTLMKAAERAAKLEGDFVECGVDRGGTATCVLNYVGADKFANRNFYLFDTYEGLVAEQLTDEEKQTTRITESRYPNMLEQVRKNFSAYPFVRIVPGAVPHTLPEFKGNKIAYLHIDMNAAYPEVAAFEHFWPMLSPGAPVIFDDYGFPFHAPQKRALDEMARKLGTEIMMLPTCQGLTWKS